MAVRVRAGVGGTAAVVKCSAPTPRLCDTQHATREEARDGGRKGRGARDGGRAPPRSRSSFSAFARAEAKAGNGAPKSTGPGPVSRVAPARADAKEEFLTDAKRSGVQSRNR